MSDRHVQKYVASDNVTMYGQGIHCRLENGSRPVTVVAQDIMPLIAARSPMPVMCVERGAWRMSPALCGSKSWCRMTPLCSTKSIKMSLRLKPLERTIYFTRTRRSQEHDRAYLRDEECALSVSSRRQRTGPAAGRPSLKCECEPPLAHSRPMPCLLISNSDAEGRLPFRRTRCRVRIGVGGHWKCRTPPDGASTIGALCRQWTFDQANPKPGCCRASERA